MCLATEDSYFILRFDASAVTNARESGEAPSDGVEEAFEVSRKLAIRWFPLLRGVFIGDVLFTGARRSAGIREDRVMGR